MSDLAERLTRALSDRYRIESEIGSGGMATGYLAQDHYSWASSPPLNPEAYPASQGLRQ